MISFNILHRLAKIKAHEEGTGFIIDKDGFVFLVTARHVVEGVHPDSKLLLLLRHWKGEVTVVRKEYLADVCVLLIAVNNIFAGYECKYTMSDLLFGQDMYIAGFPLGWEIYKKIEGAYELFPFIKRTTMANLGDGDQLYIDIKVNPGFSGAPLFFHARNETVPRVAGIVSSFCKELDGFSLCYKINLANTNIETILSTMVP